MKTRIEETPKTKAAITGMPLVRLNTSRKRRHAPMTPTSAIGPGATPLGAAVSLTAPRLSAYPCRRSLAKTTSSPDRAKVLVHPAPIGKAAASGSSLNLPMSLSRASPGARGLSSRASNRKLR
jgi:hypothetical protein